MNKHNCFECFESDSVATNDTKHIVKGHCSICMSRMIKIYRYQGTYERAGFKKLDPVPDEAS